MAAASGMATNFWELLSPHTSIHKLLRLADAVNFDVCLFQLTFSIFNYELKKVLKNTNVFNWCVHILSCILKDCKGILKEVEKLSTQNDLQKS